MKQLDYIRKRELLWREVAEPELQTPKEAIVRPFLAARCDGDSLPLTQTTTGPLRLGIALHLIDPILQDAFGKPPFQGPIPIGHECVAEVVSCGDEVRRFHKGDRVIVPWAVSCGECFSCRHGTTSKCSNGGGTVASGYGFGSSLGPWGGMICDRFRVPFADAMLVPVPREIDPLAVASASDNLSDGYRTVARPLKRYPGATVLIVGGAAKSIGLYAAGVAVALKASKVDYLDSSRERLEIAQALGANPVEIPRGGRWLRKHAPKRGGDYLVTVDASCTGPGLNHALRSLAPGGECTGVGYYLARKTGIPAMQMYLNCSTLHIGLSHPRADLPDVLKLVATGALKPEKVTTLVADWEDAPKALLERTTKVVLRRGPLA